jgi:hypothetical protein
MQKQRALDEILAEGAHREDRDDNDRSRPGNGPEELGSGGGGVQGIGLPHRQEVRFRKRWRD